MKIRVICVGKTIKKYWIEAEEEYLGRLKHYCTVEKSEIPEIRNAKSMSVDQIRQEEGQLILRKLQPGDTLILLDENGAEMSSVAFSEYLGKHQLKATRQLVFVVGGAYGFSTEVLAAAQGKISLSKMTFSHQMVRAFFFEQLYRGFTILRGEPYHHQ